MASLMKTIGVDNGYSVRTLDPMERGHIHMDRFENGNKDYHFVKAAMQVWKHNQHQYINAYGNAKDMVESFKVTFSQMEEYEKRVTKLFYDDYPELWI